jgi:O-methyltransferase
MSSLRAVAKKYLPAPVRNIIRPPVDKVWYAYLRVTRGPNHEYHDRFDFFRKALKTLEFNGIKGDYAEFGCCGGGTFGMVYKILTRNSTVPGAVHLWAFDSFEGLPESTDPADEHPVWYKGNLTMPVDAFHKICKHHGIPRTAYTTVPGFYEQSLAPDAPGPRPEKIRLAYIDCDMYSSTKTVLEYLKPRLQHGMILGFDDYYCYSANVPSGERLAVAEAFSSENLPWRLVPYVQFGWAGMSFVVESAGALNGHHDVAW